MTPRTIAIVGASLAGTTAAVTLRDEGYDGSIVLIGEEPDLPYDRPPLSKGYLAGECSADDLALHPESLYAERRIELMLGHRVQRLDLADRGVVLSDDSRIRADAILIATGARNRRPSVRGISLDNVHQLRTRADFDALSQDLVPGMRAVVAGMGFIGCEVAAALRVRGLDVVAVEATSTPLERVLGPEIGRVIADLHAEHGVTLVLGEGVGSFEGQARVEQVRTSSGRAIPCDLAIAGFGVQPNVELAEGTDIAVGDGIVVDERCRTSVEGVFAAGDVAFTHRPALGGHVRVEHWRNAMQQGAAAARSMLGTGEAHTDLHWFWSDQYDANIQYSGHHREWDELVVRGSLSERRFAAFYLKDRVPQAVVAINNPRELRRARRLLLERQPVDPEALRSEDVDLSRLAGV